MLNRGGLTTEWFHCSSLSTWWQGCCSLCGQTQHVLKIWPEHSQSTPLFIISRDILAKRHLLFLFQMFYLYIAVLYILSVVKIMAADNGFTMCWLAYWILLSFPVPPQQIMWNVSSDYIKMGKVDQHITVCRLYFSVYKLASYLKASDPWFCL